MINILFAEPKLIIDKLLSVLFGKKKSKYQRCNQRLYTICVNSGEIYKGTGSRLLLHFHNVIAKSNIKEVGLTVRINNHRAIKVYKKAGYKIIKNYTESYAMVKKL